VKIKIFLLGVFIIFIAFSFSAYIILFSPSQNSIDKSTFIVSKAESQTDMINRLRQEGFVKNIGFFNLALRLKNPSGKIVPGGYYLSKNQSPWQLVTKLTQQPPDMKWLTVPEGWRKEQIGEALAQQFNWTPEELSDWNDKYTALKYDYLEGVYFPDTYLIPIGEKNYDIAQRMINHFNEKFASYPDKFAQKNILWTTGLKIASLIQRETNNPADMPIISGIIWNRLEIGMKLDIDATLQYAKGKANGKWWGTVTGSDKFIESPYNTYLNKGLPPTPICNPGLEAIDAALNPAQTDCIFYLHDHQGVMHCAKTYTQHLENVDKYLSQ
jgi:UPF0755 protein